MGESALCMHTCTHTTITRTPPHPPTMPQAPKKHDCAEELQPVVVELAV